MDIEGGCNNYQYKCHNEEYYPDRLAMQAEATLKRAIIESIVAFSKKTDAILHSAIMVNIALADKQRILSSGILNTFLVLIYRTLCLTPFIPAFR